MPNKIGVMQGRLLPKYQGRYQAHPIDYWQDEFVIAEKLNLDCIEFIFDFNDAEKNPLLNERGLNQIKKISEQTGVIVKTICADYFMEAPLHSDNLDVSATSQKIMSRLLSNSKELGISDVVIPCVDQSTLSSQEDTDRFVEKLIPMIDIAEKLGINLSLETDLAPQSFMELLNRFNSERVTVNYDIGNSAALGFDPIEELSTYGNKITDIHIKDRVLNGGSVILGQGNADFKQFFKKLKELNYQGPFIMQAYRDEEGIGIFLKQLNWFCEIIKTT